MAGVQFDTWTPATPLVRFAAWSERRLESLTRGKWWAWKATLISLVVAMVFAAPPFGGWAKPSTNLWVYDFANSGPQLFDPHVDRHDATGNLTFRVVPRLIGAAFGFDRQWQFYVVQLVFGVLLLWAVARIYEEALGSRVWASLLTLATASTWAGATAWVETRGLFDVVGIALLALCMRTRRPWAAMAFAVLAGFSDERAVIALPLVVCWHALRPGPPSSSSSSDPTPMYRSGLVRAFGRPLPLLVASTVVIHLFLRTWLKHRYGLQEGGNRYPQNPFTQSRNWPNGFWSAFEGLWLVIVAGIMTLVHRRRWAVAAVVALAGVPSLLAGVAVVDITRAIAYSFPLAPLAALGLWSVPRSALRRLVWVATGVCLLSPMVYAAGDQTVDWFAPLPIVIVHLAVGSV